MRIWKFDLRIDDLQIVEMPLGAQLLTVQEQGGWPRLWALCDESAPIRPRRIAMYGTGRPINEHPGIYIATFQIECGELVFHAFEELVHERHAMPQANRPIPDRVGADNREPRCNENHLRNLQEAVFAYCNMLFRCERIQV